MVSLINLYHLLLFLKHCFNKNRSLQDTLLFILFYYAVGAEGCSDSYAHSPPRAIVTQSHHSIIGYIGLPGSKYYFNTAYIIVLYTTVLHNTVSIILTSCVSVSLSVPCSVTKQRTISPINAGTIYLPLLDCS